MLDVLPNTFHPLKSVSHSLASNTRDKMLFLLARFSYHVLKWVCLNFHIIGAWGSYAAPLLAIYLAYTCVRALCMPLCILARVVVSVILFSSSLVCRTFHSMSRITRKIGVDVRPTFSQSRPIDMLSSPRPHDVVHHVVVDSRSGCGLLNLRGGRCSQDPDRSCCDPGSTQCHGSTPSTHSTASGQI